MGYSAGCLVTVTLFVCLLLVLAMSRRRWGLSAGLCRKTLHVTMGLACLAFPEFVAGPLQILGVALLFTVLLALLRFVPRSRLGAADFLRATGEASAGEFWFVAGIAAALSLAGPDRPAYTASVLVLTFADTAAALVGRRIGRVACWGNAKTLEGSAAFAATTALCLAALVPGTGPHGGVFLTCGLVCLVTTLGEAWADHGSDNFWIPLLCAAGFRLPQWLLEDVPQVWTVAALAVAIFTIPIFTTIRRYSGQSPRLSLHRVARDVFWPNYSRAARDEEWHSQA